MLRDGVYELRPSYSRINYRILYGFVGKNIVLISHGIVKEKRVPAKEIDQAVMRLAKYKSNPKKFGAEQDIL